MYTYQTNAGRINEVKGEILAHAEPVEVLAIGCEMRKMPKKMGDNITYRRWLPRGATTASVNTQNRPSVTAAAHLVQEGVTPPADSLTPVDVNVKQQQYACLYTYTDVSEDLHEDDIPEEMKLQTGERMALVREMIRYGALKASTNVIYEDSSETDSRATVDRAISLNGLRRMTRVLKSNHTKKKTRILGPSANYETKAVEAAYIVLVHTDAESDIRDLPNFVPVVEYGQRSPINENELGTCEEFRFITSPELSAYADSGVAVGSTGLYSTTGTNIDVYPYIVMGMNACFDVALKGGNSFGVSHIPLSHVSKSDALNQRGYVGAKFYCAVKIVNGGWMGIVEAGISTLR